MQSTVSSQPPRQICTHFRMFCSPPPRESRVSGYSWRSRYLVWDANNLPTPKHQRCSRGNSGKDKIFHSTLYLFTGRMIILIQARIQVSPSPLGDAYMCQWTGAASVQVMACRLFGAKPLPGEVPANQRSLNRNSILFIHEKAVENVVCQNGDHFVEGGEESTRVDKISLYTIDIYRCRSARSQYLHCQRTGYSAFLH